MPPQLQTTCFTSTLFITSTRLFLLIFRDGYGGRTDFHTLKNVQVYAGMICHCSLYQLAMTEHDDCLIIMLLTEFFEPLYDA